MLKRTDMQVLLALRQDARRSLTMISRQTHIPISTIFERLKQLNKTIIRKNAALVDFGKLGFQGHANVLLKIEPEQRKACGSFLAKHQNVNSAYKVNNGFDYLIDVIFPTLKDVEDFLEELELHHGVKSSATHYVVDEIVRESFLSDGVKAALVRVPE